MQQPPSKRQKIESVDSTLSFSPKVSPVVAMASQDHNKELVRLMLQTLRSLNYNNVADLLEKESGEKLESKTVEAFRTSVMEGKWEQACTKLQDIPLPDQESYDRVKVALAEQKYLELIESGNHPEALTCLREEITPLNKNSVHLLELCSLMMCKNSDELKSKRPDWNADEKSNDSSTGEESKEDVARNRIQTRREKFLTSLQQFIPGNILVVENRLQELLRQATQWQVSQCLYHNSPLPAYPSVFVDYSCPRSNFPTKAIHVLSLHEDEVWYIEFSHCGKYLASASKDKTAIIWDLQQSPPSCLWTLSTTEEVEYLAWSPDDTKLLTCGSNRLVKLWDTKTGKRLRTYRSQQKVASVAWLPNGEQFLSVSSDRLTMQHVEKEDAKEWSIGVFNDMRVHRTKDIVFLVSQSPPGIRIFSLTDGDVDFIPESDAIISLCMSTDSKYALVNLRTSQQNHLWDVEKKVLVQKYSGHTQQSFVIRSCFGGVDENFVVSGSEDSQIYIWHRQRGTPLEILESHSGAVNTVKWNPTNPSQFASCSDDKTIKLWGPAPPASGTTAGESNHTSELNKNVKMEL